VKTLRLKSVDAYVAFDFECPTSAGGTRLAVDVTERETELLARAMAAAVYESRPVIVPEASMSRRTEPAIPAAQLEAIASESSERERNASDGMKAAIGRSANLPEREYRDGC
jgi:hypothetical protein